MHETHRTCCVWATGKTTLRVDHSPNQGVLLEEAGVQKICCFLGCQSHHHYQNYNNNNNNNNNKNKKNKKHNRNDNHSRKAKATTATPTTTTIAATQITSQKYVPWNSQLNFHSCSHYRAIKSSHTAVSVRLIGEGYILHV